MNEDAYLERPCPACGEHKLFETQVGWCEGDEEIRDVMACEGCDRYFELDEKGEPIWGDEEKELDAELAEEIS